MRVIIAGGRDFDNYNLLEWNVHNILKQFAQENIVPEFLHISQLKNHIEIVCGKARGADTLGENLAVRNLLPIKYFPANWDLYGKSAGYKRNEQMALYAKEDNGVLIAFWNGQSKGTKHMIDLARKHGLRVFVVNY